MEKQATVGTVWSRLVWALTLTLIISGWGLLAPSTSESGTFSFQGATVESLGDDLFRVRHICTSSGIPGVLPPGCYSGAVRVNPSDLTLQLVEGGEDSPPHRVEVAQEAPNWRWRGPSHQSMQLTPAV